MLRRAVANLISNALRHARPGSQVDLRAWRDATPEGKGAVVLAVINEGAPVAPELLARLFDRFYRADESRHRDAGGSGLGLAIVRAIMVLHGGSAQVRQPVPGRMVFELRFPDGP
jgi:two-component system heavy metal sensor histidine kinase CusS